MLLKKIHIMKHCLFFLSIIILSSCGSSTAPDFKKTPPDTIFTTVLYAHNWANNNYRIVTAEKIIKDTFKLIQVDSMTQTKQWSRDSTYTIPFVDTARNGHYPILDSLGKPKMEIRYIILPIEYILKDYNKKWNR